METDEKLRIIQDKIAALEMCKCGVNAADDPHPCPYDLEINDKVTLCTCCEDCTVECGDNI